MKFFLFVVCLPFCASSQSPGRADDSLRRIADTMHYPSPFAFTTKKSVTKKADELFNSCYNWVQSVKDSLHEIIITKDIAKKKIVATNVPATADITYSLSIAVSDNSYTMQLNNFIYHTADSKRIPVSAAVKTKQYKETVNVERVLIMRNYPNTFQALADYLKEKVSK